MAKGKDAMGQEVDSLYLSLGLNIADLELGFETAGKTVKQAMSRLNSEANQIRLKADIDVTRLEAAGKSVEALKVREKALNDELAVQQKKLEMLNRAYEANAKTYGKDSGVTRGVDTKRLYQLRDIERLKAEITQVNGELAKTATASTSAFGKLGAGVTAAQGKITGVVGSIGKLNAAITAGVAAVSAGAGIFALTDKAMMAGENLYKLSTRLQMTQAEASKLSKIFQLSGTDINSVVPIFARIDKQVLASAKSQNSLSKAMSEFGFALTDSNGNLLSYDQKLAQLAKGYQNAVKSGREAEFVTNVLGAKGAALIPVLQDLGTNLEIVSRIKGTGLLNKDEAHQLYIEWQAMQMQAGQLTGAIGQALMPVAKELMPEITQGFKEFATLIADNKDGIKEFGSAAGTVIGGLASSITTVISLLGDMKKGFSDVAGSTDKIQKLKEDGLSGYLNQGKTAGLIAGGMVGGAYGGTAGAAAGGAIGANIGESIYANVGWFLMSDEEKEAIETRRKLMDEQKKAFEEFNKQVVSEQKNTVGESVKLEQDAAKIKEDLQDNLTHATSQKLKEQLEAIKDKVEASVAEGKTEAAAWVSVADDIKKAMKDAAKEAQEANKALDRSIYKLTHNDYQNALKDIDYSAEDTLKKGADPEKVAREAELKREKVIKDTAKETTQYLDNVYEDSLTKRLNQIDREKKAWIQKGMDEVTATRAAEKQKQQALSDSVKTMFTSQKEYLDLYRSAMNGAMTPDSGGFYDFTQSDDSKMQNAVRAIQRKMMEDAGVDPRERTTMAEVRGFQKVMNEANNWGSGLIADNSGLSELSSVMSQTSEQTLSVLEQINNGVPEINNNLSQILGAIDQSGKTPSQINVNPSINVDLGGAYVFDDAMKQKLTDDITNNVANAVTSAVNEATSRINTGFGN